MSYATIDDVFKRYNPVRTMVGSGANDISSVDVSSIFVADSEGFVDAYLRARYTTPVVTEPLITMLTSDIAIYKMGLERLPRIPDFLQTRYDNAVKMLEMLRDGQMLLQSSGNTGAPTGDNEVFSTTSGYHPVFSPVLDEVDQQVDTDWVTSERDVRDADG